jgi:hypothetical protein
MWILVLQDGHCRLDLPSQKNNCELWKTLLYLEAICVFINVLTKLKYLSVDVTLLRSGYVCSTHHHHNTQYSYTGTKKSEFTSKMF